MKRSLSVLLILAMLLAVLPLQSFAAVTDPYGDAAPDTDFDGIPDAVDTAPNSNVFTGKMKSGHDGTTTVSFTVDFRNFFGDNTVYHPELATFSVLGAALCYYAEDYSNTYLTFDSAQPLSGSTISKVHGVQLMQVYGFEDVVDYKLDSYGDDDICEIVVGHRNYTYEGETKLIVGIWVRGTDAKSQQEWSSNFHMGDLVRFFDAYDSVEGKSPRQSNDDWTRKTNHRGFDVCATRLLRYLKTYYLDQYVQPVLDTMPDTQPTYWLAGHSRGAAVANLMGSYLIDEGAEVFAYTFAAPYNTANTEASAEKYDCIFNLVNANDFVPMLPMPEWGFTRFGRTAEVDASQYSTQIKNATGTDYSGNYLSASDMSTLLGKFICITGENADRNNPGKILGWREVYVYHCGHDHPGETVGNYQSTTFVKKQSITNWGGPSESSYNGYATRLRKYSYWHDGICETPAYDLQVLVELLVAVANGETLGGASTFITSNKLADKFDFDKWSLISYATKLTEPHFMDTYSVIQAQINAAGNPGARFHTLKYYTASNADGGRPVHTHTYTYVPYEGHEPTCTAAGLGYRYCTCSDVNADYYDDVQKNVEIPALGHDLQYTYQGAYTHNVSCSRCTEIAQTEDCVFENNVCILCGHEKAASRQVSVFVVDELDGQDVYSWAWGDAGNLDAAWPGHALSTEGTDKGGHNYYKIDLDVADYNQIIFNRNGQPQTATLNVAADAGENNYVVYYIYGVNGNDLQCSKGIDLWPAPGVVTEPTCTEAGYTTYTGMFTGEIRTENQVPALGHQPGEAVQENYVEPTATAIGGYDTVVYCQRCGAELSREHTELPATGPVEPEYNGNLKLFYSFTLGEEISSVYTIMASSVGSYVDYYVVVERDGAEPVELHKEDMAAYGTTAFRATYNGIAAKEMNVAFTATLYAVDAQGQVFYGPSMTKTVKGELKTRLEATTNPTVMRTLCADMLNYGAAAQIYFDYDTENLVNTGVEYIHDFETAETPAAVNHQSTTGEGGNLFPSASLSSRVVLQISTQMPNGSDVKLKVMDEEGNVLDTLDTTAVNVNLFKVNFDRVGAKNMRTLYKFQFVDEGGVSADSKVLTWSVESFVAQKLAANAEGTPTYEMARALLIYGDSAAVYLEGQN